ncbi:MAG: hypothetical protein AAB725_00850 [Patescibacteria group bacterium]
MAKDMMFIGPSGRKAVSLVNATPIAAPLIELRLLGPRYDPQGAITPKPGSKVKTVIRPMKKEKKSKIEVNRSKPNGPAKKVTQKGVGKGRHVDFFA